MKWKFFFGLACLVLGFIMGYAAVVFFSSGPKENMSISVHLKKTFFSNENVKR